MDLVPVVIIIAFVGALVATATNHIKRFIHAENSRMFKAMIENFLIEFTKIERRELYETLCEKYEFDKIDDH